MFHVCLAVEGTYCKMCVFNAGIVGMGLPQTWHLKYTQTKNVCECIKDWFIISTHLTMLQHAIANSISVHFSVPTRELKPKRFKILQYFAQRTIQQCF